MGVRRNPPAYGGRVKANSMMNLFHTDEESTLFTEWSFKISLTLFGKEGGYMSYFTL